MRHASLILAALGITGCVEAPLSTYDYLPRVSPQLVQFDVELRASPDAIADLRYQAPSTECPWAYEISSSYEPVLEQEPNSVSHLAIGPAPRVKRDQPGAGEPIPSDTYFTGRIYYRGIRAEKNGMARDVYLSNLHAGPTAPTAGCLPQTWDPVEDAMTLGWPKLTGRVTSVDETWTGLRVAGKCNRSACVDPQTGGGGPDNHHRDCVTMDWANTLVGIYEIEEEHFALLRSVWTDGHGAPEPTNKQGIWSERLALISLEHGRPTWVRATIHHNFPRPTTGNAWAPITRTWEMTSIDECGGSMSSVGWDRPPPTVEFAAATLAKLANTDDLLSKQKKSPKTRATRDGPSDSSALE